MQRLRRGSAVRRIVISVIALYAVLLQGIFAPPAAAFGSLGEITCVQSGSRSEAPGGEHHHHGLCCIIACAASASVYVAGTAGIVVLPLREASRLAFTQPSANLYNTRLGAVLFARTRPSASSLSDPQSGFSKRAGKSASSIKGPNACIRPLWSKCRARAHQTILFHFV